MRERERERERKRERDSTAVCLVDRDTCLSDRALGINKESKAPEQTFLTPFNPVLHALTYADRHATLIDTLLANYNFLE